MLVKHAKTSFTSVIAAAAGMALLAAGTAHADTKTLYIGMNGGNMERTYTQFVFPPFEKANNVKVVVVPGTSTDILAKAQATKGKAQMHVMTLDDGVMFRAIGMGLCEKLKPSANLSAVPAIKRLSHLPIIVDPSQGTGRRDMVAAMSKAAIAAGADGLIIEVHPHPEDAMSDGQQTLTTQEFAKLMEDLKPIAQAVGRSL